MKKQTKLLALLMSVVMVLGVMAVLPMTVSAKGGHTDFDLRYVDDFIRAYDTAGNYKDIVDSYARVDYVPYVTGTAPTLDGVIDATKYTVENPVKTRSYVTESGPSNANNYDAAAPIELNEYFAQDATYLYMGFELPYYSAHCKVELQIGRSSNTTYGIASDSNSNQFGMWNFKRVNIAVDTAGTCTVTATNATAPSWTVADVVKFKAPEGDSTTAYVEFKLNKAELQAAVGAADANSFNYALGYGAVREDAKSLNYVSNALLKDAVMQLANAADGVKNNTYYGRQICRNIGLVDYSAYENINVRTDLEAYGYKNYVVKGGFTSPSVDGVIDEEGYGLVANTLATDVKNNMTGLDIVEYYAHDEDYVYYALTVPYDGDAPSVYIRLAMHDTTAPESNYYNSQQIVLTAAADAADSTFVIDGGRNAFPGYATNKANFETSDIEFAGVLGATTATYELKISRAKMAAIAGTDSIDNFAYYTSINDKWNCYDLSKEAALLKGLQETRLFNTTRIGKNVKLVAPTFETADLGSARIAQAETSGLRFKTTVSKAYIAELEAQGYTVSAGTLIAPTDYITDGRIDALVHTENGLTNQDYIDVKASLATPYEEGVTTITFTGSIVGIKDGNLARNFSAVGYLALTKDDVTTYEYSDVVASKNIKEIAQAELDENAAKYNDTQLAILNKLAGN